MKRHLTLLVVCAALLLTACTMDSMAPMVGPRIFGFTPGSGKPGDTVILTGANFSPQAASNAVALNGTPATVINATIATLKVTVPAGASTGRFSVTVGGVTAESADSFRVTGSGTSSGLAVTSFTPAMGVAGDVVTITGTGFSTTVAANTVTFANNVTATVTAATATQLTVTVPAAAVTGTLSVSVNGQTAAGASPFEILLDIPRNGLVAYYPFSGDAKDASGHAFDLTLVGTYTSVPDRFGLPGKAYWFNGGNSMAIATNNTYAQVTQPFTIGAWVKYDSLISSAIVGKYNPSPGGYYLNIIGNASGGAIEAFVDGGTYYSSTAGIMPGNTAGQWIFILMSYDGTTMKFYKNGAAAGTVSVTGTATATTSSNIRIGLSGWGGTDAAAFKCAIDDVVEYNRVLSDAEVVQLYNATVSKK